MMGIKSAPSSSLAYNGTQASAGLYFLAHGKTMDYFVDTAFSIAWLGNAYHRDPKSMFNRMLDLSIGGMASIYTNDIVSLKAGGAFGGLGEICVNKLLNYYLYAFSLDAKTCIAAKLKLPRRFSVMVEDRIPFVAFITTFNNVAPPRFRPDSSFKAFPGNDFKVGICRALKDGKSLMLALRHYCYSSGGALPNSFRLQFLDLGIAFRFGFTKHYDDDL